MSDLFLNKLAFCVLGTGLLMTGLSEGSRALFPDEKIELNCDYCPPPSDSLPPPSERPRDYHALFAVADVEAGKTVAAKCLQCHKLDADAPAFTGPPLYGVLGRDIGSIPGFRYSSGAGSIGNLDGEWTYEKLDHFLERPRAFASATSMNFVGIRKQEDRVNLIAYLRTLTSGEPEPLP